MVIKKIILSLFIGIFLIVSGCDVPDVNADLDAKLDAKVSAKIASPEFKQQVDKSVSNYLESKNEINTGTWGINISNLNLDGSTVIILIPILLVIFLLFVGIVLYILIKNKKLIKLVQLLGKKNVSNMPPDIKFHGLDKLYKKAMKNV